MIRNVILIMTILAYVALAAPHSTPQPSPASNCYDYLVAPDKNLNAILPTEAKDYLKGIPFSESDQKALMQVDYRNFSSITQLIETLKKEAPDVGRKAEELYEIYLAKVKSLSAEAKEFLNEMTKLMKEIAEAGGYLPKEDERQNIVSVVDKYNTLSNATKNELEKAFPVIAAIIKSEKMQRMIKIVLEDHPTEDGSAK